MPCWRKKSSLPIRWNNTTTSLRGKFKEPVTQAAAEAYAACWNSSFYTGMPDEADWDYKKVLEQYQKCVRLHRTFLKAVQV